MHNPVPNPEFSKGNAEEEKILRRIPREIIFLSTILTLVVFLLFGGAASLFFFLGGIFSAVSFLWLKQSLSRFLLQEKRKAIKLTISLYALRILLILAVFFIIIYFFSDKIIAFAAGFSVIIPVFLLEAVAAFLQMRKWKN
jgi:hypothetical protein